MRNEKSSKQSLWQGIFITLLGLSVSTSVSAATMCGPGPNWIQTCTAGQDMFASDAFHTVVLFGIGQLPVADLFGPTVIQRGDPTGSPTVIPTQITSATLSGGGMTLMIGGSVPNVAGPSTGQITQRPTDPSIADSFFDVFFVLEGTPLGPLHNTTAAHMQATAGIDRVPPLVVPGTCATSGQINCYYLTGPPVPLLNQQGLAVGQLVAAVHEPKVPEPATAVLSSIALVVALVLGKKKLRMGSV